ncbi:hypothetical protein PQV03_02265 [Thermoanaerobacterium thermosaccharolyticum]|uniref:hypothetical protein n=1 Tax=Thermoanaerobacterium thermosaccharolyticum TaxID=1517 RepID=UPI003D2868E7
MKLLFTYEEKNALEFLTWEKIQSIKSSIERLKQKENLSLAEQTVLARYQKDLEMYEKLTKKLENMEVK